MIKKTILYIFIALFFTSVPAMVFAIADIAVLGGYTSYGKIQFYDSEYDSLKGYNYGVMAHLNINTDIIMIGGGFYFHGERLHYTFNGDTKNFNVNSRLVLS